MNKAFSQFCDQNGLSQKYIENSSKNYYQEGSNQNQRRLSTKNVLKSEISKPYSNAHWPSSHKSENESKSKHSLENTIDEYMVSNRKLQATLNMTNEKYYNLKMQHAKCEGKRIETKEHIDKLEQDLTLLSEKWSKLTNLK